MILGTVVGTYLIPHYGLVGLTIGSTGGWMLSQVIMNVYYQRVIGLNIPRFLLELCRGLVPSFAAVLALGWLIDHLPGEGWLNLGAKIALYSAVYILVMLKFGVNKTEADMFRSSVPKFSKRNV